MNVSPRLVLVLLAAGGFGLAWATWWDLTWNDALGTQSVGVTGAQGSGGLAQILPVAALGGLLATLTLRCLGRRVIAAVVGVLFVSMGALGFDSRQGNAAALASTVPAAALATDPTATATLVPTVYALLGALGTVAAVWFGFRPGAGRPERKDSARGVEDTVTPWKAMDEGFDPTSDEWDGERS